MSPKEKLYTALAAFLASAASVFAPLIYILLAVSVFLFLDFVAAVAAASHKKTGFSWPMLINSIPKAMIYFVIIVAVFYAEIHWLPGTHLSQLFCVLICRRELKSINRHSKTVLGEDLLSVVVNSLKKK